MTTVQPIKSSLTCDILIIGGGATGAATAYDLATRGLDVILVEQNDWSTGTSGRYHGLLHSGGRYVVRDPESARECIIENYVLRSIAPHTIEDTGGMFVAIPGDPEDYVVPFVKGCADAKIPIDELTIAQAHRRVPALNPKAERIFSIPDASCDSFDLIHSFVAAAKSYGVRTLNYHKVIAFETVKDVVIGATVENRASGETVHIHTTHIINASGPWASEIAALANLRISMRHSKGVMVAMNVRWTNVVLNRLKPPSDGDIIVPVGTVCVVGTTSITVPRPDDYTITPAEISQMLDEGELLIPGFKQARALRAWAGVRPLYDSGKNLDTSGRDVKRTFEVLDHETRDGMAGLSSIVGGKLTTCRMMAERIADGVCVKFGIDKPCITMMTPLPIPEKAHGYHQLRNRLNTLEHAPTHDGLICECELVTRAQLENAIRDSGKDVTLDDLRRDLRLGMGPCQAGFCGYRAAGVLQAIGMLPVETSVNALRDFVEERFRGDRPLLWGHQLRQTLLDETIYRRSLGLSQPAAQPITEPQA